MVIIRFDLRTPPAGFYNLPSYLTIVYRFDDDDNDDYSTHG